MLIEFSVENYRSFRESVVLSMLATPLKGRTEEIDRANIFEALGRHKLVRSAAIYGANASGKTNLVRAMGEMRRMVLNSARESNEEDPLPVEPFVLQEGKETEPSTFEIVFVADGTQYRYGFSATTEAIVSEWLYYVPTQRESLLFNRDASGIKHSSKFKEGRELASKTRPNSLFLSVVAQFNGEIATTIRRWFLTMLHIVVGFEDSFPLRYSMLDNTVSKLMEDKDSFHRRLLALFGNADLGIMNFTVRSLSALEVFPQNFSKELKSLITEHGPKEVNQILTEHEKYDENEKAIGSVSLDLEKQESHGTQKLFTLAGPLVEVLKQGSVLVVDELDARLHPLLTRAIIELFQNSERNPRNAQLIFATHDSNLLTPDLFRRDQIWFTEKSQMGCTKLISLAEYRGVRNNEAFHENYLRGKYGAVPIIRDLGLFDEDAEEGESNGSGAR